MLIHEVCQHFQVSRSTALSWIDSGELAAVNVAPAKGKYKLWRVSQDAIKEFERKRANRNDTVSPIIRIPTKNYF